MAKSIIDKADDSKKKKKKNKCKKKSSSSSSDSSESGDFCQELALQVGLKPKQLNLKEMVRLEDLTSDPCLYQ